MNWAYPVVGAILALALYGLGYSLYDYLTFSRRLKREAERLDWLRACSEEDRRALNARMKRERNRKGDWHGDKSLPGDPRDREQGA